MSKQIAAISLIGLALLGVSTYQISTFQTIKNENQLILSTVNNLNDNHRSSTQKDGLIELATSDRMASVVSYLLAQDNRTLTMLKSSGHLDYLAQQLREDYIDENVYARLNGQAYLQEIKSLPGGMKQIREKWFTHIAPGSHFDRRPEGSLLIPGEAVKAPLCNSETESPYIAYALLSKRKSELTNSYISIIEESLPTPQYRVEIFENSHNITSERKSLNYRALIDIGCTPKKTEEVISATNQGLPPHSPSPINE